MADNYEIPFGVNASDFFNEMNKINQEIDKTQKNVDEAGKGMQDSFNDAANAGDKLGKELGDISKKSAELRSEAKSLGKELGEAMNGKQLSGDFEARLSKFGDMLGKFSKDASRPIKFNIDDAKLKEFEDQLANGANELKVLDEVIKYTQQLLSTMDPNTDEFKALNAQLQIAEGFMEGLGDAAEDVDKKNVSLRTQLRNMKQELADMEMAGKGNTDEFKRLSQQAGELEDQIGDVSARVRVLASDTKYIDAGIQALQGLAGGFAVAQGAAALFGGENEEVEKTIKKLTAVMAILQGLQTLSNALNKDSALSVLVLSRAQRTATTTTTALAGAETAEAAAATGAAAATKSFTAALLVNPITWVVAAVVALVAILVKFTDTTEAAEEATQNLNDALERQNLILSLNENALNRHTELLVAQAKLAGKAESDVTQIQGQQLAKQLQLRKDAFNEFTKLYNDWDSRRLLSAEDNKKLEDELITRQEQIADDENKIAVMRINKQTQRNKEAQEAAKKALEQQKKNAEAEKKMNEQRVKFAADLEQAQIDSMADGYSKERQQALKNTDDKINELNKDKALSAEAEKTRATLIKQLRANLTGQLIELDQKEAKDRAALQLKANELSINAMKEGAEHERAALAISFEQRQAEINDQFKYEFETRDKLLAQLAAQQAEQTKKLNDEISNRTLEQTAERAALEVETATKYMKDVPGIEEKKQVAILEVRKKYAKMYVDQLIAQGNAQDSLIVLNAKKTVTDLDKELKQASDQLKEKGGFSFFDLLGLGDLSETQRRAVTDAAEKSLESVRQITDFIVDQYQRQIDKKQEVINQYDDSIKSLEDQIAREKELRDQGFANNITTLQAELDAKKAAREQEFQQQQELLKRQQQIQRAQLIVDTITQASNLITAATKIFSSLAGIPFVGIPLAIASIGLMTGAFVAAKVKAFQLVNDQKQSFADGGWIDGKAHSQGGQRYISTDGSGGVVELEGGEHVTNKRQAAKYADLLEAINNDSLGDYREDALAEMLKTMGIHLMNDENKMAVDAIRERNAYRQAIMISSGPDYSDTLENISDSVGYLAQRERGRDDRWEDDNFYYIKSGNKTTKIKKNG